MSFDLADRGHAGRPVRPADRTTYVLTAMGVSDVFVCAPFASASDGIRPTTISTDLSPNGAEFSNALARRGLQVTRCRGSFQDDGRCRNAGRDDYRHNRVAGRDNNIDIEGACEGVMACSTCHVIVASHAPSWTAPEEEEDLLDLAWGAPDVAARVRVS